MSTLISQGLLSPHSKVLRTGSDVWHNISQDEDLRLLLAVDASQKQNGETSNSDEEAAPELAGSNFALFVEFQSDSRSKLHDAIRQLGPAKEMANNFWVLNCALSAGAVRNALVPYLGNGDTLFVIDASHNKTAWFNFGPEADAKIRQVWVKD